MKKMTNSAFITGYVYNHDLKEKVTGPTSKNPGTEFIQGTLNIATDEACMNVVSIYYSYVTPTTKSGGPNNTYNTLKNIIDGKYANVMESGKENATKVRCDTAIALNEWFDSRNDDALVSVKRLEGGFIHVTSDPLPEDESKRATFSADMVITNVREVEADADKGTPDKVIVKGAIFNFRNALLPVEFTVTDEKGIPYFAGLGASNSNPIFTSVKGNIVSQTIVRTITEESAFGDAAVREVRSSYKDYLVNWASPEVMDWDDESTILASEFANAISEREVYLAAEKQRTMEYRASKNVGAAKSSTGAVVTAKGTYNF